MNHNIEGPIELKFFARLINLFKPRKPIKEGQLGVYYYTLSIYTSINTLHDIKYDIFVKVKALVVYNNLVEVECVGEPSINESVTPEMASIIKTTVPKYLEIDKVKWQA